MVRNHVAYRAAAGAGADERVARQDVAHTLGQRGRLGAAGTGLLGERLKARLVVVPLECDRRPAPGTKMGLGGRGHGSAAGGRWIADQHIDIEKVT